jgi:hypothetical protein
MADKALSEFKVLDMQRNLIGSDYYAEKLDLLQNFDNFILYHGTTSVFLDNILKNGLLPRKVTGNSTYEGKTFECEALSKDLESNPDNVYLGGLEGKSLGMQAVNKWGGNLIILRVMPDIASLVADEDSRKDNFRESLAWEGCCASSIPILPERFLGYYEREPWEMDREYTKLMEEPEDVLTLDWKLFGFFFYNGMYEHVVK